jgi:hypothetical protein
MKNGVKKPAEVEEEKYQIYWLTSF